MVKRNHKKNQVTQRHVDRWADLMQRIINNPEIADRIPNHANLLFGEGDVIFINGEPRHYSELTRTRSSKRKTVTAKSRLARVNG
jgi:hypothetical protein